VSEEAKYYRVGLFVFTGIVVLVMAVMLFGGTDLFRQTWRSDRPSSFAA
jgi:hypothetical protein